MQIHRDSDGTLPAYAWPGGYPIVYTCADNETLCPDCANGKNGSLAAVGHEDRQWNIVGQDVHWEGEPIICAHCNKAIESAYGPVKDNQ